MISTTPPIRRILHGLLAAAFWVAVWQLLATAVDLPLLLPGPLLVAKTLISMTGELSFWSNVGFTLLRILEGFVLGTAAGFVLAVMTAFVPMLQMLLSPAIRIVRATPVASFILLCMLWMNSGVVPAFISGLMVLPVVWGNVSEGFAQTDPQLLEMTRIYGMGRIRTFFYLYLPAAMPYFRSACITAIGLAWKSGVAAEVLCQPRQSIGTGLYYAKIYLETAELFAWTAVVVLLSILVEKIFSCLLRKMPL